MSLRVRIVTNKIPTRCIDQTITKFKFYIARMAFKYKNRVYIGVLVTRFHNFNTITNVKST